MDPAPVAALVIPVAWSSYAFVAIVLGVAIAFVVGVGQAGVLAGEPAERTRVVVWRTAAGVAAWLALTGGVSASGLLERAAPLPPLMMFFAGSQLTACAVALSPLGTRLLALPLAELIAVQAFRLPLELVLDRWALDGTLPLQMTFHGDNFDIVTGALAIPTALVVAHLRSSRAGKALALAFNLVGLGLLVNVACVAVLSSPLPLRAYMNDPPVLLAFNFPYGYIVPVCVAGALLGHLLVFRALLRVPPGV